MTPDNGCAVPGCTRLAVDDAPLCRPHLIAVNADICDALLNAWQLYALSQSTADAASYTRRLHEAIRDLRLTSSSPPPVQLRLVK